ncbi:hypothetical protein Glove_208g121 [Diversispora epigaea]|uniref:Uncharacterized protein n=1 Tax=Diversispora epigaea TaxID=1348612 RepID=A0A397IIZ5_9GLOM|nr:hypothetical protein Glove_208g121 [Diversispora epigaea]
METWSLKKPYPFAKTFSKTERNLDYSIKSLPMMKAVSVTTPEAENVLSKWKPYPRWFCIPQKHWIREPEPYASFKSCLYSQFTDNAQRHETCSPVER